MQSHLSVCFSVCYSLHEIPFNYSPAAVEDILIGISLSSKYVRRWHTSQHTQTPALLTIERNKNEGGVFRAVYTEVSRALFSFYETYL